MSTCEHVMVVTNRRLCHRPLLEQLTVLAAERPGGIILREKDMVAEDYRSLAEDVLALCAALKVPCILHHFVDVALALQWPAIHLSLPVLQQQPVAKLQHFARLGVSVHSVEEAQLAWQLGATYLTAGHIFATDCKQGLPGRGLAFLTQVCQAVPLPVYAIGGINATNQQLALSTGAAGICLMSAAMTADSLVDYRR